MTCVIALLHTCDVAIEFGQKKKTGRFGNTKSPEPLPAVHTAIERDKQPSNFKTGSKTARLRNPAFIFAISMPGLHMSENNVTDIQDREVQWIMKKEVCF